MDSIVPQWWPTHEAIYDINLSYLDNVEKGPFMNGMPVMKRKWKPKDQWIDFLGHKVASPLGVPAGPLLTSKWIDLSARLGFDVVTYKTIRSNEFAGHPLPNVVYVDGKAVSERLSGGNSANAIPAITSIPTNMEDLAITNSFGMPSRSRSFLEEDIPRSNACLEEGQLLIVSVVGTASHTNDKQMDASNFIKDFAETALFAKKCGAKVIEANFSCPNVTTGEGSIYTNPDSVFEIASAITQAIGDDCPLVLKVGTYKDEEVMTSVFKAAAKAKVKAICGINSVSMSVVSPTTQEPALGPARLVSGICGGPIRASAIDFIKKANHIIQRSQLPLTLIGCGGITEARHFTEFLDAGAKVAMSATGMMWDPYLAARYHLQ
jgi:dihydroorotate dehydrogenase